MDWNNAAICAGSGIMMLDSVSMNSILFTSARPSTVDLKSERGTFFQIFDFIGAKTAARELLECCLSFVCHECGKTCEGAGLLRIKTFFIIWTRRNFCTRPCGLVR